MKNDSLLSRCFGLLRSPRATFNAILEDPRDKDSLILSGLLGFLIFVRTFEEHALGEGLLGDLLAHPIWMVFLVFAAGVFPIYFSATLLHWLIRLVDRFDLPAVKLRAVLAYSLGPFVLALTLMTYAGPNTLQGLWLINLILILWSWSLMVFGIIVATRFPVLKGIFIFIVPLATMFFLVSSILRIYWIFSGGPVSEV